MLIIEDLSRIKGFRFPRGVIGYTVWAYHRFALSFVPRSYQVASYHQEGSNPDVR
jgi:transposase-like protein